MSKKKTNQEFLSEVKNKFGDIFIFENEYDGAKTKMKFKCKRCGYKHNSHASNILNNMTGCSNYLCDEYKGKKKRTDVKVYLDMLNRFHKGTIIIKDVENLVNAHSKLNFKCLNCDNEWFNSINHLVHGSRKTGCPNCKRTSSLESLIKDWLDYKNISYIRERTFKTIELDGKAYNPRFDFYLVDKDIVIEVHGEQHYTPIDLFGGESGFIRTVKTDYLKFNLCKDMDLKYIEISYLEIRNGLYKEILEDSIFNDYPEREYTQASGKGESSVKETE